MSKRKLGLVGLLAGAPAVLFATAWASASSVVVSTFDNSSSFTTSSGFPAYGSYGLDNNTGGPQVPNVRFDNGDPTPTSTFSPTWSSTDFANSPSSGSLAVTWDWNEPAEGGGNMAFTMDIFNNAETFTNLSFDIMVAPGSAVDQYGGIGYFQMVTRNQNYAYNGISTFAEELGNPTYSSPDEGTWEQINIPLPGGPPGTSNQIVRALTFQINGGGRTLQGQDTIFIDNVVLSVPEPASLGMIAFAGPAMLLRRRRKV
jgi:hypothetical protein